MARGIYLTDAYARKCPATVAARGERGVTLDQTVFYPSGGGQPADVGELVGEAGQRWSVASVEKGDGEIWHHLAADSAPAIGQSVTATIDWPQRYVHMRFHTALHLLSGAAYRRFGAGITGGQIYADRARMDFPLPEFNRSLAESLVEDINRVVAEDRRVLVRSVPRSELASDPSLVRVDAALLPDGDPLRLIDIEGYDVQADGGTHVRRTAEVGQVTLEGVENKGSRNKRLYLRLEPRDAP